MKKRIYKLRAFHYSAKNIRRYCKSLLREDQKLFRIYYYDTEPLKQKGQNPVSKTNINFGTTEVAKKQNKLLDEVRECPNFALRLGVPHWNNNSWNLSKTTLKKLLSGKLSPENIKEGNVSPEIRQKGVDMKIGLDIAALAYKKLVDKIIIITGDQDFVPALKLARKEGIVVGVDTLGNPANPLLREHTDFFHTKINQPLEK